MKRILSIILLLAMIIGTVNIFPISIGAENSTKKVELTKGEVIEFGSYPQAKVTDDELIAVLNSIDAEWISYDYYISGTISDYMKYKDVEYNDEKYRAVLFTSYRPNYTINSSSADNSNQDDNGYVTNTIFWFKYEPIEWRVLDPENGLVLCDKILDSRDFYNSDYNNTESRDGESCYANSYKHSNIRKYLTDTFYDLAFTTVEKEGIVSKTISSNDYSTDFSTGNDDVTDSVFLLSYTDVLNTNYGFDSENASTHIINQGTDYAKCQGLRLYSINSHWWLRSTGIYGYRACIVNVNGLVDYGINVNGTYYGVCPALYLNLESASLACELHGHTYVDKTITKSPTCTEVGTKILICEVCGEESTGEIPALGHNFENNNCTRCGYYKNQLTQGETIELGSYPQTEVTDEDLISSLDLIEAEWISYNYYIENVQSDFMKYKDVEYNGEKYRAVTFTSYRPNNTCLSSTEEYSNQDDNGYDTDTIYWFKYEPIKWKVIDPEKGLVVSESIIDSQEFYISSYSDTQTRDGEECYANSYKHSSIRKFLTETLFNLAFNSSEKEIIVPTTISSNDRVTDFTIGNGDVTDSIFLIGYNDVTNSEYYSTSDMLKNGTDYAKCQGLYVSTDSSYEGVATWWLRSAGAFNYTASYILYNGTYYAHFSVDYTYRGVCPAIYLNLENPLLSCLMGNHIMGEGTITKDSTCTDAGIKTYTCDVCGKIETEEIPALGHVFENNNCTRCGYFKIQLTQGETIELGSYPQTKVTDEDLISSLNAIECEWISYNYYGNKVQSDFMKYKDVEYNGEKYRAVTFTSYRPIWYAYDAIADYSNQDDNGYETNTVYWFKYEPLKWKVLDPDKGLVLCESIIDSQEYYYTYYVGLQTRDGEECYSNSYKHSTIRKFLTDTFYNIAFNSVEKEIIVPTTI